MRAKSCYTLALCLAASLAAAGRAAKPTGTDAQESAPGFTFDEAAGYPFPTQLVAAGKAGRIAWAFNERGRRNIWIAEAPAFSARRLTAYNLDDGQELSSVALSPRGDRVVYVRGGDHGTNWDASVPVNATSSPVPPTVAIWSVPFDGGEPVMLGEGDAPAISPKGDVVAFERDRRIWLVPIDGSQSARRIVASSGTNGDVVWAPDGSGFAFVSNRGDHALIGIYRDENTPITWLAPSTSRDNSPRWSPDGSRIVFVRRPGSGGPPAPILEQRHVPWSIWIADAATGQGQERWRAPGTLRGSWPTTDGNTNLHWAARDRIVFLSYVDGWPHLYSMPVSGGAPELLTPGAYMAEHISLTPDRTTLIFSANAGSTPDDIDRRHVVKVPVDRAAPEVLTEGSGIEWGPVVTGETGHLAYLGATAQRPPLPIVRPLAGGAASILAADRVPSDFPAARLVTPRAVSFQSSDGLTIHAQLFEHPGGGRRPAVIYVHGGPPRQMLLGWHYSDYYSRAYALNQYLASRGFVVLSVNYRLGIGYGHDFHRPPAAGPQGASEYLDVKAAALFLQNLPQVDAKRIGIYGGSYGGYLTALALARDSSLFAAGVDIHGVHDWTDPALGTGRSLHPAASGAARFEKNDSEEALAVAWKSSPVFSVAAWKSPVLLIHGDEDRNVRFGQTVDLARRLEAAGIRFEELVIPDDTHHWMRHANMLTVSKATAAFLERTLATR